MGDSLKDLTKKFKQLRANYLKYNFGDVSTNSNSDVYANVKGRMYGDWIDLSGRSNSYSSGDLIENPIGLIESIIRDEILSEHNLIVSAYSTIDKTITFGGTTYYLSNTENNYYQNAYIHNIDKNWVRKIDSHSGSLKKVTLTSLAPGDISNGDRCYITNIQGNNLIDYSSFDTAMGSRSGWDFALSLDSKIEGYSLLDQLCFEAQVMLYKNYDKYYIKTIGTGTSVGTLSNPLKERNSNLMLDVSLSDIQDVYTDFIVNYAFLPNENSYAKTLYCNKSSSNNALLSSTYRGYCADAETNYKVIRKLEINLDFVHDETTAVYFLQRLIKEKTRQRMIVGYIGDTENHIQYEKGDLVLINVPERIPTSKNNSTQFLIVKQDLPFKRGNTEVIFKLVEMIA